MSECKESVDVVYFESNDDGTIKDPEAMDAHGAGALAADEDVIAGGDGFIYLHLPSNNDKGWSSSGALHVHRGKKPEGMSYPSWQMTGDVTKPETLTLHPSVWLKGTWHGWLRGGKLQSC